MRRLEPDDLTVFLTAQGEPFSGDHMTSTVKERIDAANLGKTGACQLFHHTMATLMHENGADILFIQEMLGHARLDTTRRTYQRRPAAIAFTVVCLGLHGGRNNLGHRREQQNHDLDVQRSKLLAADVDSRSHPRHYEPELLHKSHGSGVHAELQRRDIH